MALKKKKTDLAGDPDAIELLIADHRRVAKLFGDFKNLQDDGSDQEKAAVVARICRELSVHCAIEEELFYPTIRKAIEDEDLMDEALVEQRGAKALVAELQAADPSDALYDAKVTVLGEQVDHHVHEEEGNMFAQARATDIDLRALGADMLARRGELEATGHAARTRIAGSRGAGSKSKTRSPQKRKR